VYKYIRKLEHGPLHLFACTECGAWTSEHACNIDEYFGVECAEHGKTMVKVGEVSVVDGKLEVKQ
jgi:hypothetical protein